MVGSAVSQRLLDRGCPTIVLLAGRAVRTVLTPPCPFHFAAADTTCADYLKRERNLVEMILG
jgi:hypothetical protein